MIYKLLRSLACCASVLLGSPVYSQLQSCPVNINFSAGDISSWAAKTGLVSGAAINYPAPNNGVATLPEYSLSSTGIRVITSSTLDLYGSFPTIPTINGYAYNYSIQIGSTATSYDLHSASPNPGGFTRAVTYVINVPAGPITTPYTMTYAYAMVLENGTHNSNEQPLFKATLSTPDSIISCASPEYYLPTFNNTGSGSTGATLDTATAIANGFTNSTVLFLSHAGAQGGGGTLLQDVWTKGWTEVTFDLSPYRGQQVRLTFESDNCAPGAHFAYAYVALRNTCAGLEISGPLVACANTETMYSIPSLAGATYLWGVPGGWTITSGSNTNIIHVMPGVNPGKITVNELNSCANLKDTIDVSSVPPTVPGAVITDSRVCAGTNSTALTLAGNLGGVLNWISSTDGVHWTNIPNSALNYTAQDLTSTTQFRALVQNGPACNIDTSGAATILVDQKSVGGILSASNPNVCANQTTNSVFTLTANTGSVLNWQFSHDNTNWTSFSPVNTDSTYSINSITQTTQFRTIVKNGVCPADTSTVATINFINVPFPQANIDPDFAAICFGKTTAVNATINVGTNYSWSPSNTLTNQGGGTVNGLPLTINAIASPPHTTDYVLTVTNAGCPNPLTDTFHVSVAPKITVFAGNDTAIVANQPLQLNATVSDSSATIFNWTPATGLNSTTIANPIATLGTEIDFITYTITATRPFDGCSGTDNIKVTVFKTGPDIFVPGAFTPNGDGLNDQIFPICVGIKQLTYFRIYNRWGQLIFSTSQMGKGWDGTIAGVPQGTNNFVYMAQAVDYLGHVIFKKGNVVLIR